VESPGVKGFERITSYAPARIVTLGVARLIFGLLLGLMGGLAIWGSLAGEMNPTKPGDMPAWWMGLVGAALAFTGFCYVSGAVGRIISAFAKYCYFSGGPAGMIFRVPKQGWFGRFRVVDYNFAWNEVSRLVHFTNRVNFIPISTELRIELKNGKRVSIPRHYFTMSSKEIQERLAWYCNR
jgi:hypothetical protein